MKNILLFLVLIICFNSCRSTKKSTHIVKEFQTKLDSLQKIKNKVQIDTIKIIEQEVIVDQVENNVMFQVDCDSLGKVKNLNFRSKSGPVDAEVSIENNQLQIKIKIDSITSHYEKEYRSKFVKDSIALVRKLETQSSRSESNDTEITKYRIPWWVYVILALLALNFLRPKLWK